MLNITIQLAGPEHSADIAALIGELLNEIMQRTGHASFHFDLAATEARASELLAAGKYWAFLALDDGLHQPVGVITLYESYALYTEGAFGTIPELYVRPDWRSQEAGAAMLARAETFAQERGWSRLEVTTPALPAFERTLRFYEANGFEVSGGRKLKLDVGVGAGKADPADLLQGSGEGENLVKCLLKERRTDVERDS